MLEHRPARALGAALLAGVALAAGACGDDEWSATTPAALDNAKATVETWLRSCAEENGEAAVEPLTPSDREIFFKAGSVPAGCENVARLAPGRPPKPDQLRTILAETKPERVKVDAGFGTATLRSPTGSRSELDLELDRGQWRLSHPHLPGP